MSILAASIASGLPLPLSPRPTLNEADGALPMDTPA